jgi:hypothetical protein
MAAPLTAYQKKAIETILTKVQSYCDARYAQARRFNPNLERSWEDLSAQQFSTLRLTLSAEKMFGPVRYNVAELLLSDDAKKRADFFLRKAQNCLLSEIIENKEASDGHKTAGAMEIHDMRTLCSAIDAALDKVVVLIQTFIWWDLEDACDWGRFESKANRIQKLEESGLTDELADYFRQLMGIETKPNAEQVILYECRQLRNVLSVFRTRRAMEAGYQAILRREQLPVENPSLIIEALAGQQNMLKRLRNNEPMDDGTLEQFARAMGCEASGVTPAKAIPFLDNMIQGNMKRLKASLNGSGTGAMTNMKMQQLADMEAQMAKLTAGRNLGDSPTGV